MKIKNFDLSISQWDPHSQNDDCTNLYQKRIKIDQIRVDHFAEHRERIQLYKFSYDPGFFYLEILPATVRIIEISYQYQRIKL